MHRHDLDLIAALADGSLEDETQARQRLESCQECRLEYEAQTAVLAALGGVDSAVMTDYEKASLHRDVWTALRSGQTAPTRTVPWWYRWSYAAAGLLVVVGLVTVVTQMGGDAEQTADVVALDEGSATDGEGSYFGQSEAPAEEGLAEPAAAEDDSADALVGAASLDFGQLALTLRSQTGDARTFGALNQSEYEDCLTEAGLEDHTVIETYSLDEGEFIAIVPNETLDDLKRLSFLDLATCEVVHTEE